MTDKESVIEGLEHCKKSYCYRCPYVCDGLCGANCTADLASDVLDLLKEQAAEIERLEHDLAVTEHNINYYVNGNR